MKSWLGAGILTSIVGLFFAQMEITSDNLQDVDKSVSYVGANYTAEASVNKQLMAIKAEDITSVNKFSQEYTKTPSENMQYGIINEGADTGYFGAKFKNSPEDEIDFGDIPGGDITIESVKSEDFFNTFVLNYNKTGTNSKILVTVAKNNIGSTNARCDFDDYEKNLCSNLEKIEINTGDSSMNGKVTQEFQTYFQPGDDGYTNKLLIQGFDPVNYNYRITFATIDGEKSNFSYHVLHNGTKKKVTNNIIEIDTIGNAIDDFSRIKLQKRVSSEISPLGKYVLFSNGEIAK